MSKRRGKRVVVGYVVSHTGKRGGPWEGDAGAYGFPVETMLMAWRCGNRAAAEECARVVRIERPNARALPLVRYELDAEEERLRDAVVEAAVAERDAQATLGLSENGHDEQAYMSAAAAYDDAVNATDDAVRALRAHREKVGR